MIADAAISAPAPEAQELVIVAERIRRFRFKIRQARDGALTCLIKRKSGDPALDAVLCDEARICVGENNGAQPDLPAFEACLRQRFDKVRLTRAAARQGAAQ